MSRGESTKLVERREAPRFSLVLAVSLENGVGHTRDASTSGVFFTTPRSPSLGAHIKFSIDLEHADPSGVMPIVCEGQVVRIEPHPDAFGVAVRIRSFSIGGKQTLGAIP